MAQVLWLMHLALGGSEFNLIDKDFLRLLWLEERAAALEAQQVDYFNVYPERKPG